MISVVKQWPERPACLDHDPELFFPHPGDVRRTELAKEVCAGCPARLTCLVRAIENHEQHGVWGGVVLAGKRLTKKEADRARSQLAQERARAEAETVP